MDKATFSTVIASLIMLCAPILCGAQFTTLHTGPAGSSLEAIDFPSPAIGYAVGKDGAAYKSNDGGHTWDPLNTGSGAYLFGVSFLDESTGFASGGGATVLKTMDGGDNWTQLSLPFTECIYQVRPINNTFIVASGWGGYFFRSINGGTDWTMSAIDPNWQGWVFGMDFLNADTGVVAEADGRIYHTVDGGANWTPSTTSTTNTLRGIGMPTANTGWAAGFFGTVQRSMDGGANWSTINTGYPGDSYYGVHFTDAEHGVICGGFYSAGTWQGVIMRTANGGTSWSRIFSGGPMLNGITINDGSIFAVGANEVIVSDVLSTSVEAAKLPAGMRVSPNPFIDRIRIASAGLDNSARFQLFTLTGELVLSGALRNGSIDTQGVRAGCYVLEVHNATSGSLGRTLVVKM